jgi:ABC-type nitrate/sulfonate/bicarbonate transport system permease component
VTRRLLRALVPVAAVLGVFVLWGLAVRVFDIPPTTIPAPVDVFRAMADDWDVLSQRLWTTVTETAIGFVLGAVVGFVLAVAMSRRTFVRRVVYPVLIASQAIPIPAIAAPLVIILGFGLAPKILIVAFIVFFPVVVNVLDGLASVDRDLLNLARIMDGRRLRIFRVIELPATVTPLFSALKLGATYAVTGAVIGEALASLTLGLGNYLTIKNSQLDTEAVYAAVLLLSAIGVGGFLLVSALEWLVTPWRTRTTARRWRRRDAPAAHPARVSEDVTVGDRGGGS